MNKKIIISMALCLTMAEDMAQEDNAMYVPPFCRPRARCPIPPRLRKAPIIPATPIVEAAIAATVTVKACATGGIVQPEKDVGSCSKIRVETPVPQMPPPQVSVAVPCPETKVSATLPSIPKAPCPLPPVMQSEKAPCASSSPPQMAPPTPCSVAKMEAVPQISIASPCPISKVETVPQVAQVPVQLQKVVKVTPQVAIPVPCPVVKVETITPQVVQIPLQVQKMEKAHCPPQITVPKTETDQIVAAPPLPLGPMVPISKEIVPCPSSVPVSSDVVKIESIPQGSNIPSLEAMAPVVKQVISAPELLSAIQKVAIISKAELVPQAMEAPCSSSILVPNVPLELKDVSPVSKLTGKELFEKVPSLPKTVESMMTKMPRLPKELSNILYGSTTSNSSCTTSTTIMDYGAADADADDSGMVSEQNVDADTSSSGNTFVLYGSILLISLLLPCLI